MNSSSKQKTDQTESVDVFIEKISLLLTKNYWDKIGSTQEVRGKVDQVNLWNDTYAYLTISNAGYSITGRCPVDVAPSQGDNVVFSGTLYAKPSKVSKGFDFQLIGEPVGSWVPTKKEKIKEVTLSKESFRPLTVWIESNNLEGLLFIGTEIGIQDAISQLGVWSNKINKHYLRMGSKAAVLDKLDELEQSDQEITGIVFLRGGDDKTLDVWDDVDVLEKVLSLDKPFYTAIGHAHRITMIDKYADQSFHSPSAFGNALSQGLELIRFQAELQQKVIHLRSELSKSNQDKSDDEGSRSPSVTVESSRNVYLLRGIIIGAVITLAIVAFF